MLNRYREGDWFAVPLRTSGYGVGLIARLDGRGGVLGYLLGRKFDQIPSLVELSSFGPPGAIRVLRFGDLGLIGRTPNLWKVIGRIVPFYRESWVVPTFARRSMTGECFGVVYADDNFSKPTREFAITDAECEKWPADTTSGAEAVELILTHLLDSGDHPV